MLDNAPKDKINPNKQKTGLAKATGSVAIATLASRILGLVRDMTIASYFGAAGKTDAFFVAFKIPNLLRRLVAEGALSSAFIPIFTEELKKSEHEANKAVQATFGFTLLLTILLSLLGMFFAENLTAIFAPGFLSEGSQEKFDLATSLTRLMFPYIILVSLLSVASGVLNVLGKFALPAFAPAILNIAMISAIFLFHYKGITSLAWGVLVGGLIALLPQLLLLKKLGYRLTPKNPFKSKVVKDLLILMSPAVLSASVYQLMVFINTLLASYLKEGSVSWLYYADRLFQFPLGIFSIALATALLPALSRSASENDESKFSLQLEEGLTWINFVIIPASFGLFALSTPLVDTIYNRGSFSVESVKNTAASLQAFSIGLWAVSCQTLLARSFLAKKNTKLPALISIASLFFNSIFALSLMGPILSSGETSLLTRALLKFQGIIPILGDFGHVGLALAGSLSSIATMLLFHLLLSKIGTQLSLLKLATSFAKSILASMVMFSALYLLQNQNSSSFLKLLIGVPLGAICYFTIALILRDTSALEVYRFILRKISK